MSVIDILAKIGLAAIGLFVCFFVLRLALNIGQFAKFEFSQAKRKDGLRSVLESILVYTVFLGAICYGIYSYFN